MVAPTKPAHCPLAAAAISVGSQLGGTTCQSAGPRPAPRARLAAWLRPPRRAGRLVCSPAGISSRPAGTCRAPRASRPATACRRRQVNSRAEERAQQVAGGPGRAPLSPSLVGAGRKVRRIDAKCAVREPRSKACDPSRSSDPHGELARNVPQRPGAAHLSHSLAAPASK